MLKRLIRRGIERGLRPYGYRLVNPSHRYGIDLVADVTRLSRAWGVEVATVFDVGANVGATTLAFRAAWPRARIVAFEPDGETAGLLRANVAAAGQAGVGEVSVEEVALGDREGEATFYVYAGASDLGSLNAAAPYAARHGLRGRAVSVRVTTLDGFCGARAVGRVNLLKVDAEGSDHAVLLGARGLLAERRVDFVACEFNGLGGGPEAMGSLSPIADLLGAHGLRFVASYNDYIDTDGPFFAVSNALFAAEPSPRAPPG